jgi:hypothetical protein
MATAHAWVVFRSLGTSHVSLSGQLIQYIACVYTPLSRGASVQTQARPLPLRSLAHSLDSLPDQACQPTKARHCTLPRVPQYQFQNCVPDFRSILIPVSSYFHLTGYSTVKILYAFLLFPMTLMHSLS